MAALEYFQYAYMSDNYGVLIHAPKSGETASIDCGDAEATIDALKKKNWSLSHIFATHHHADHVAGLEQLKNQFSCHVTGPAPGHTKDMINYYLPTEKTVFTGDTLFTLGCGRLFEGDAKMMWNSLNKLMKLPADTTVYSSHEYTEANAAFAVTVDPQNTALTERVQNIKALRANGEPTVPSTMTEELATNPFLRASDPAIRQHLNMTDATDEEVFAEIRSRKDNF